MIVASTCFFCVLFSIATTVSQNKKKTVAHSNFSPGRLSTQLSQNRTLIVKCQKRGLPWDPPERRGSPHPPLLFSSRGGATIDPLRSGVCVWAGCVSWNKGFTVHFGCTIRQYASVYWVCVLSGLWRAWYVMGFDVFMGNKVGGRSVKLGDLINLRKFTFVDVMLLKVLIGYIPSVSPRMKQYLTLDAP